MCNDGVLFDKQALCLLVRKPTRSSRPICTAAHRATLQISHRGDVLQFYVTDADRYIALRRNKDRYYSTSTKTKTPASVGSIIGERTPTRNGSVSFSRFLYWTNQRNIHSPHSANVFPKYPHVLLPHTLSNRAAASEPGHTGN